MATGGVSTGIVRTFALDMRLIIDQGNSATKLALFEKERLVFSASTETEETGEFVSKAIADYEIEAAIYCTVRMEYDQKLLDAVGRKTDKVVCFDEETLLPITVGYHTPHTLGCDRIAAVVGARECVKNVPLLVIDAGTAITYDLLSADDVFVGGNIAPGVNLRLQSLHEHTEQLPLVSPHGDYPLLGQSTEAALRSGTMRGIQWEIEGYIGACEKEHKGLLVFLTGGDAEFLAAMTKRVIFVDRNLVSKGLNRILEYNVEI